MEIIIGVSLTLLFIFLCVYFGSKRTDKQNKECHESEKECHESEKECHESEKEYQELISKFHEEQCKHLLNFEEQYKQQLKFYEDWSKRSIYKEPAYEDLLKQPEGDAKRLEILQRDKYKCKHCGSKYNLQVHHKYYLQYPNHQKVKPGNYPDDALITLCKECHHKIHQLKKIKVYYKKYDYNS